MKRRHASLIATTAVLVLALGPGAWAGSSDTSYGPSGLGGQPGAASDMNASGAQGPVSGSTRETEPGVRGSIGSTTEGDVQGGIGSTTQSGVQGSIGGDAGSAGAGTGTTSTGTVSIPGGAVVNDCPEVSRDPGVSASAGAGVDGRGGTDVDAKAQADVDLPGKGKDMTAECPDTHGRAATDKDGSDAAASPITGP